MIAVRIASISVDTVNNAPVVLLRPVGTDGEFIGDKVLPIWIGHPEAMALVLGIQEIEPPRPMTHDLLLNTIGELGYSLEAVRIVDLDGGTFFAELVLEGPSGTVLIDSRPSDSMALAVRDGCPILVAEKVMEGAGVVPEPSDEADEDEEVERFREFLEKVEPNDFSAH